MQNTAENWGTADVLRTAWELCTRGCFEEAQRLLGGHVDRMPDDIEAWILLAKLCQQRRDYPRALAAAAAAARLNPAHPEALYTLGRAHRANGTWEAAEDCYRRALAAAPQSPDILTSLGVLLRSRGETEQAIELYRRALAADPAHAEAANNLGNALAAAGKTAEAREFHERGRPALAAQLLALRSTADALLVAGKLEDALATLSDWLRIAPQDAELRLMVGTLESSFGRHEAGLEHIEEAARLDPDSIEANEIARRICTAGGLYERAVHYGERMLALAPTADVAMAHALLLPGIQQSRQSIRETRDRYERGLSMALAAVAPLTGPTSVIGKTTFSVASHTAFYLAYHGENNRDFQMRLARVYLERIPGLAMIAGHCTRERSPGRLRVGFISRFFCKHSIGTTSRGLIEQLSRDVFEVYALRIMPSNDDATTQAIRAAADRTVDLDPELALARVQIAALELDVLFYQDIGMEPISYFLAFARLAPVQCVSFGHPDTTGIPNMDYFVSNDLFEPEDAAGHYSEELFLLRDLPTLAYYYKPSVPDSPAARERYGFTPTENIYLCPQTLFKVHPDFDALLHGILSRDPKGVVVLIEWSFKEFGEQLRRRFERSLPSVAQRVRFIPQLAYGAFLELLAMADVILDTIHFNGMNTSLEAFASGTPVVTWPGAMQRGRHTQAMYRKMGLTEGLARDADDYVDIAVRLGTDRAHAASVRKRILANNAVLYEDPRVVREFERFFLEAVERSHFSRRQAPA
jgi:protein O-GlcNAc transferase